MEPIIYSKISNQRDSKHNVITCICRDDNNQKYVEKKAEDRRGQDFIDDLVTIYSNLSHIFIEKNLSPVMSQKSGDSCIMEYAIGMGLDKILQKAVDNNDRQEFFSIIDSYRENVTDSYKIEDFATSNEFIDVFGEIESSGIGMATRWLDIDLIPQNILVDSDGNWKIIDYEWTFNFLIPINFLFYRAVCYFAKNENNAFYFGVDLYDYMDISNEEKECFKKMEAHFQRVYLDNKKYNLDYLNYSFRVRKSYTSIGEKKNYIDRPIVFIDNGNGFFEKKVFNISFIDDEKGYYISIPDVKGCIDAKLQLAKTEIIFKLISLTGINEKGETVLLRFNTNGCPISDDVYYFGTKEPYIEIKVTEPYINKIDIQYHIDAVMLSGDTASHKFIQNAISDKNSRIQEQEKNIIELNKRLKKIYNVPIIKAFLSLKCKLSKLREKFAFPKEINYRDYRSNEKRFGKKTAELLLNRGLNIPNLTNWSATVEPSCWAFGELEYKPKFSVIVPVYNVDPNQLIECVESIIGQSYENYELILVDDKSSWKSVRKTLSKYEKYNNVKIIYRNKNGNISEATNTGIDAATGEFLAFCDCDDVISTHALYEVAYKLNQNSNLDFIYSDEDKLTENGKTRHLPFFKSEWAPDSFNSMNYTNHLSVFRTSIAKEIGGLRTEYNGSQDYDFTLRFMEHSDNKRVGHIDKILYHWRERKESVASNIDAKGYALDAARRAKEDMLKRRGLNGSVTYVDNVFQYRIVYKPSKDSLVSIIIPSKDNPDYLFRCISSIEKFNDDVNYEIVLVDNGSIKSNKHKIEEFINDKPIKYIYESSEFNYSHMCNLGADNSAGDFLLFLNDDIEAFSENWLSNMLGQAELDYVGAVGAKLYYPKDKTIQHCGVVNLPQGPCHSFLQKNDNDSYYSLRNKIEHNWIAVTGACLMVKKSKYYEVGGFDETFPISYNDVDLCFKLYESGYYNVLRADSVLYHHESVSRGYDAADEDKTKRLEMEKSRLYEKHPNLKGFDPYYSRWLKISNADFEPNIDEKISPVDEVKFESSFIENNVNFDVMWDKVQVIKGELCIGGWFKTKNCKADNSRKLMFILKNTNEYRAFKFAKIMRFDVLRNVDDRLLNVGFNATFDKNTVNSLKGHKYQLGLCISGETILESSWMINWSDKFIEL